MHRHVPYLRHARTRASLPARPETRRCTIPTTEELSLARGETSKKRAEHKATRRMAYRDEWHLRRGAEERGKQREKEREREKSRGKRRDAKARKLEKRQSERKRERERDR